MAEERNTGTMILGLISLAVFGYLLLVVLQSVYNWAFPPDNALISLAAYFDVPPSRPAGADVSSTNRQLRISGQAHSGGNPLAKGAAKLTVERLPQPSILRNADFGFKQTAIVPVLAGNFDLGLVPVFAELHETDSLKVTAEIWSDGKTGLLGKEVVSLNSKSQEKMRRFEYGSLAVLGLSVVIFFWAFTGSLNDRRKNRTAIMFSYFVLFVSLAVPLAIPVFLPAMFPEAMEYMRTTPVGVVVTGIKHDDDKDFVPQWALNIGGYATAERLGSTGGSGQPATNQAGETQQDTPAATLTAPESGAPPESTTPESGPSATNPPVAIPQGQPSTGQPSGIATNADEPDVSAAAARDQDREITRVQGGLVIPLYVILLSIVGGAINMTRQVPKFQRDVELLEQQQESVVGQSVTKLLNASGDLVGTMVQKVKSTTTRTTGPAPEESKDTTFRVSPGTTEITSMGPQDGGIPSSSTPPPEIVEQTVTRSSETTSTITRPASQTSGPVAGEGETGGTETEVPVPAQGDSNDTSTRTSSELTETSEGKPEDDGNPPAGTPLEAVADATETRQTAAAAEKPGKKKDGPPPSRLDWRTGLLNQYMYLISAPFIAIATYYLLSWLDLRKVEILVLVSFSIGLISELILSRILEVAGSFLRRTNSAQAEDSTAAAPAK